MKIKFKDTSNKLSVPVVKPLAQIPFSSTSHFQEEFLNHNNFNKKSVKSNSSNLAFTGFLYSDVTKVIENSGVKTAVTRVFDKEKLLGLVGKHLGSSSEELFEHLTKPDAHKIAKEMVNFDGNNLTFKKKTFIHLLMDGVLYPFKTLPFDIMNGSVNLLKKVPGFKANAESLYDKPFLKNSRLRSKVEAQVNALRGLLETADDLNNQGKSEDQIKSQLFQYSGKLFDSAKGKYDTKHERTLNRIVSGMIPAVFLANDAYNLSRMCNDNEKEAKAEKKARFKQEASRVGISAYLTLITMSALTKYINKSVFAVMANVAITTLVVEMFSRLSAGKHIKKLTPEQAKQINAKSDNNQKADTTTANQLPVDYKKVFFKSAENRQSLAFFKGATPEPIINKKVTVKSDVDEKKKAPLLSFNTFMKVVGGIVVSGYALKGIRQNKGIDKIFVKTFEPFKKLYTMLTKDAHSNISKEKFDSVIKALEKGGFEELVAKYRSVAQTSKVSAIANDIDGLLTVKTSELKEKLESLEGLAGKPREKVLTELFKSSAAINKELGLVVDVLEKNGLAKKAEEYSDLLKSLSVYESSEKEILGKLSQDKILKPKNTEKFTTTIEGFINKHSETIYLGSQNRKIAKPFVDFAIGPFKFAWDLIHGTYSWADKIIDYTVVQIPEKMKKIFVKSKDALVKAAEVAAETAAERTKREQADLATLGQSIDYIHQEAIKKGVEGEGFKSFINDNINRSFNVDNLSSVSNSGLANVAKAGGFVATLPFLMSDNYNMVMLKSNGNDKDGAELKSKERFVQEGSRFFYSTLLISLFNNTFKPQYNNSLFGMAWVTAACTIISENLNRKSVGVPVGEKTRSQMEVLEKKREEAPPALKAYYGFMARLTGKKSLAEQHVAKQQAVKA